jgi:hypothetical protein
MDRRLFLKMTGLVAAASALEALPVAAAPLPDAITAGSAHRLDPAALPSGPRLAIQEPGIYQISGRVRLQEPLVEISGIADTQWISWSNLDGPGHPVASFTLFQHFDQAGVTPAIQVRGGQLESLAVAPIDFE